MSKTLSDLEVGTRVYLDEAAQADFTDAEVIRSINYSYHETISRVIQVYEDYYFTTTPVNISTIANQQNYSLDSTLIKVRRVEINFNPTDTNSKPIKATKITQDELPMYLSGNSNAGSGLFSAGYFIEGSQSAQMIYFTPPPTVTDSNNAQVWGIQLPSDLAAASDQVNIPYVDRFGALIELGAAAILLRKGQQEESVAAQYRKDFEIGLQEMENFLKDRIVDGVNMVVDEQYQELAFDHPL